MTRRLSSFARWSRRAHAALFGAWGVGLVSLLSLNASWCGAGEKYAIVIGVNDCPNFRLPSGAKPRALQGAESDARSVAALLHDRYEFSADHTRLLTGAAATIAGVNRALDEIAKSAQPDDQVVLYFSGHGTQISDARPSDEVDELDEALCLYDADASGTRLLTDDQLGRWLDRLAARQSTVILDCCHAGTGTKDLGDDIVPRFLPGIGTAPTPKQQKPSGAWLELQGGQKSLDRRRTAIFACQPDQQAYERKWPELAAGERRGQFSYYLVKGLAGGEADRDGNGQVTNQELVEYVNQRLDEAFNAQRSKPADRQQPAIEADRLDATPF